VKNAKPLRLAISQIVCRHLPPIISQRIRSMLYSRRLAARDNYSFLVRSITGSFFRSNTRDYPSYPFVVHGYFNWRALAIALAVCKPGDTVIEVGANVGTETIGFADIVGTSGKVYAFEPLPQNIQIINDLLFLENNRLTQIRLMPFVVGSVEKQIYFRLPNSGNTTSTAFVMGSDAQDEAFLAKCVSLDCLMSEFESLELLFVDAEGYEVEILQGGTELIGQYHPTIVIEAYNKLLHRYGYTTEDLFHVLEALGYKAFHIDLLGISEVTLTNISRASNWVCFHNENLTQSSIVDTQIRRCGLMPCIKRLNPLMIS
jgi:FkbM family methyltransferase